MVKIGFRADFKDYEHNKQVGDILRLVDWNLGKFVDTEIVIKNIAKPSRVEVATIKWNDNLRFTPEQLNDFIEKATNGALGVVHDSATIELTFGQSLKFKEGQFPLLIKQELLHLQEQPDSIIFQNKGENLRLLEGLRNEFVKSAQLAIYAISEGRNNGFVGNLEMYDLRMKIRKDADKMEEYLCLKGASPSKKISAFIDSLYERAL